MRPVPAKGVLLWLPLRLPVTKLRITRHGVRRQLLVKDVKILHAAYNDAAGVTRDFNRNILNVINRGVDGDFQPETFRHHAFYNEAASRIEMRLVADSARSVKLGRLGLTIRFRPGEDIWTESSYKFTRESVEAMLAHAGLRLVRWYVDPANYFALAFGAPA